MPLSVRTPDKFLSFLDIIGYCFVTAIHWILFFRHYCGFPFRTQDGDWCRGWKVSWELIYWKFPTTLYLVKENLLSCRNRDFDFLASIELLVMDQADIFLMQNWDHLLHLIRHLHLQPLTTHGTDFARIRPWALDGLTKYFCQTLVFSSIFCPEHVSMMTKYFHNFAGQVRLVKHYSQGSINNVTIQIPQVRKSCCNSLNNAKDVI